MKKRGLAAAVAGALAIAGATCEAGQRAGQLVKIRVWVGPGVTLAKEGFEESEVSRITTAANQEAWARTLVLNGGTAADFALLGRISGATLWGMVQAGEGGSIVRLLSVDWGASVEGGRMTRVASAGRGRQL